MRGVEATVFKYYLPIPTNGQMDALCSSAPILALIHFRYYPFTLTNVDSTLTNLKNRDEEQGRGGNLSAPSPDKRGLSERLRLSASVRLIAYRKTCGGATFEHNHNHLFQISAKK